MLSVNLWKMQPSAFKQVIQMILVKEVWVLCNTNLQNGSLGTRRERGLGDTTRRNENWEMESKRNS